MRVIEPQEIQLADGRRVLMRGAYPSDAPALLLGLERVAREGLVGSEPGERNLGNVKDVISHHRQGRALMLVAVAGGHLVGACGLSPEPWRKSTHVLELGMFLLPEWRGSGLAQVLLSAALEWAREAGGRKVVLGVFASNRRATAFYRKMGFREEGIRRAQYLVGDHYEDELLMAYFLG